MKRILPIAIALSTLVPLSASAVVISDVQITQVAAGGYFGSTNPTRAYTRVSLSRALTDSETSCQLKNPVVISSGVVTTDPDIEPRVINVIATEYYQQMFSTALAANVSGSNIDINVTTGCTPDGRFPIANRISIKR